MKQSFFEMGNVARVLSAAVNLETLELHFDTYNAQHLYPLTLVFGESTTWPCLRHLLLTALEVDADELIDLFHRHRASLKQLELSFVTIIGKEWDEVYRSMQDWLNLDEFGTDEPIYIALMEEGGFSLGEFAGDLA